MSTSWIQTLKSEAELYLQNLIEFEDVFAPLKESFVAHCEHCISELEELSQKTKKALRKIEQRKNSPHTNREALIAEALTESEKEQKKHNEKLSEEIAKLKADIESIKIEREKECEKEQKKIQLEIDSIEKEISALQNQINPLFFWKDYSREKKEISSVLQPKLERKQASLKRLQEGKIPPSISKPFQESIQSKETEIKQLESEKILELNPDIIIKKVDSYLEEEMGKIIQKEKEPILREYLTQYNEIIRKSISEDEKTNLKAKIEDAFEKVLKIEIYEANFCFGDDKWKEYRKAFSYATDHYRELFLFFNLTGIQFLSDPSYRETFFLDDSFSHPCRETATKLSKKTYSKKQDASWWKLGTQSASLKIDHNLSDYSLKYEEVYEKAISLFKTAEETGTVSTALLKKAIETAVEQGTVSTNLLQDNLEVGYAQAAKLIDFMAEMHIVGPYAGSKPRQVLWSAETLANVRGSLFGDSKRNSQGTVINKTKNDYFVTSEKGPDFGHISVSNETIDLLKDNNALNEKFSNQFFGYYFSKETLENLLSIAKNASDDTDLPDLIRMYRSESIEEDFELKALVEKFAKLYRETPEQILITEQRYFAEKQLEEQRLANERLLAEQQEANERLLAEQQEAAEEQRRANERLLAEQEKAAENQRRENERRFERQQREEENRRETEARKTWDRCYKCANYYSCPRGIANCGSFVPKNR